MGSDPALMVNALPAPLMRRSFLSPMEASMVLYRRLTTTQSVLVIVANSGTVE